MIYLDHNATTPVDPAVARAMEPFFGPEFGNPSNSYDLGKQAKAALEEARSRIAGLIGAAPDEILFTSGGTESNNTVLKGLFYRGAKPFHIITTRIEHPAIINPALFLMTLGADVTFVHTDREGLVDPDEIAKAVRPDTKLISVMLANNETGVIQPLEEIGRIAQKNAIPLHTDAAQAVGKIPIDVRSLGVDYLTIAGHKMYAPKGIGALYVKQGSELEPLHHGAGQESGRRAGTENVALAVGLGEAAAVSGRVLDTETPRLTRLRDRLCQLIMDSLPETVLAGHRDLRLPNTLNICFPGVVGEEVLQKAPEIRASTGAACHAGAVKVSSVHQAMNIDENTALGAVRLTLGRSNDEAQIDLAAEALVRAVKDLAPHS